MGIEATLQLSDPPKEIAKRHAYVQFNALNTIVIPHDLKDENAGQWAFATDVGEPQRKQRVATNEVVYLVDGHDTLAQFQWEIEHTSGKSDFIYLLGWYLDVDMKFPDISLPDGSAQTGKTIRQMFRDAGKRGVQIRVMLDGQIHDRSTNEDAIGFVLFGGPPPATPPPEKELIDHGVSGHNPEYDAYWKSYKEKYKVEIAERQAYVNRVTQTSPLRRDSAGVVDTCYPKYGSHHQKILIVMRNGQLTAFCGGVDINADRIAHTDTGRPMHDVHCRIRGPAAWDVLQIFLDRWGDFVARPAKDDVHGLALDFVLADKKALRGTSIAFPPSGGKLSVQIGRTAGPFPYNFAPNGEESIKKLLKAAISQTKRFIYIEDQYLVCMEIAEALSNQLSSLKHLTILIPTAELSVGAHVKRRNAFIDKLKDSGVFDKVGIYCLNKESTTCSTYIHAKTWIFDDKFAVIGSANCDRRGMEYDSEVSAGIFDPSSDDSLTYTLPHRLRMQLWSHHLGLDQAELVDGVASVVHWKDAVDPASDSPPPNARLIKYEAPHSIKESKFGENTWEAVVDYGEEAAAGERIVDPKAR